MGSQTHVNRGDGGLSFAGTLKPHLRKLVPIRSFTSSGSCKVELRVYLIPMASAFAMDECLRLRRLYDQEDALAHDRRNASCANTRTAAANDAGVSAPGLDVRRYFKEEKTRLYLIT